ncbi:PREDICTED: prefoldin subunit 5-like [Acropora digitifera]|uniref:prefoldin subunit 5-like n=1 Tax=Acropora digitifera TaxID=70779 RepID=UPI00077A845C|nr:PREDICTED: prefoldin subunit 5-like [Acropora digitifera]
MAAGEAVELGQLPIPQLENLRSQLEEEVKLLGESMSQLKMAQQKFGDSRENVKKLMNKDQGKEILVPLTSAMYVPGTLENTKTVLVNVGTGYYVEKGLKEADEYFGRKVDLVTQQLELLQPKLVEKHKLKQAIQDILTLKVQAQVQSQLAGIPAKT